MRLARRLARQCAQLIGALQPVPVGRIRHLLVGRAVNGFAQLRAIERALRQHECLAARAAFGRAADAANGGGRAQPIGDVEKRPLALAQDHQVKRPELKQELGAKGCFHAAGEQQRPRRHAPREVRKLQIKAQCHAGSGHSDDIPAAREQLALECTLGRSRAAVRIEDLCAYTGRFKHAGEAPDTERWREKGVFAAVRVIRADEQESGRVVRLSHSFPKALPHLPQRRRNCRGSGQVRTKRACALAVAWPPRTALP